MEAVILIGIQASGKSSFCRDRLYNTHIRINLDMLKTRHREAILYLSSSNNLNYSFIQNGLNFSIRLLS
ncbi:MAG: hypothetical protein RIM23_02765 [Coleofasciculus sp. G3-WIS-01]|uniref:hypothetical protein n=1 Tax=Coleofasciculus sp. G3-WIS-01 TaxID=3069528 RepID=UPI0032F56810